MKNRLASLFSTIVIAGTIGATIFGCSSKDKTTVTVPPTADFKTKKALVYTDSAFVISLPTAFTPNGDGINDGYFPVSTHLTNTHFQLTISTLSGTVVYQSNDFSAAWNGKTTTGATATDYKYNVAISFSTLKGKNVDTSTYLYLVPTNKTTFCASFVPTDTAYYIFPDQLDIATGHKTYNTNETVCP